MFVLCKFESNDLSDLALLVFTVRWPLFGVLLVPSSDVCFCLLISSSSVSFSSLLVRAVAAAALCFLTLLATTPAMSSASLVYWCCFHLRNRNTGWDMIGLRTEYGHTG